MPYLTDSKNWLLYRFIAGESTSILKVSKSSIELCCNMQAVDVDWTLPDSFHDKIWQIAHRFKREHLIPIGWTPCFSSNISLIMERYSKHLKWIRLIECSR